MFACGNMSCWWMLGNDHAVYACCMHKSNTERSVCVIAGPDALWSFSPENSKTTGNGKRYLLQWPRLHHQNSMRATHRSPLLKYALLSLTIKNTRCSLISNLGQCVISRPPQRPISGHSDRGVHFWKNSTTVLRRFQWAFPLRHYFLWNLYFILSPCSLLFAFFPVRSGNLHATGLQIAQ